MATLSQRVFGMSGDEDDGANPRRDEREEPKRLPGWHEPEPEPEPEVGQQPRRDFLSSLADGVHEAVVAPAKQVGCSMCKAVWVGCECLVIEVLNQLGAGLDVMGISATLLGIGCCCQLRLDYYCLL